MRANELFCLVIYLATFCLVNTGWSQDRIESRLEKAHQAYSKNLDDFYELVRKKLRTAKLTAQKEGQLKYLKSLETDERFFEKTGGVPLLIATPDLLAKREQARQTLAKTYEKAIADATRSGERSRAQQLESKLNSLKDRYSQMVAGGQSLEGEFRIIHLPSGLFLAAEKGSDRLLLRGESDAGTHRWKINRQAARGPYTLINCHDDRLINVPNNENRENLELILWGNQKGAANELWQINGEGSTVQLLSTNNLAIAASSTVNDSPIVQSKPAADPQQFWVLEKINKKQK
jgi:hypothetical protein